MSMASRRGSLAAKCAKIFKEADTNNNGWVDRQELMQLVVHIDNSAADNGGGVYTSDETSNPVMLDCVLTSNSAGNAGGGVYSAPGSDPILTGTSICGNDVGGDQSPENQIEGDYSEEDVDCILVDCGPCDFDGDGVTNDEEQEAESDPYDSDSDDDGVEDGDDVCPGGDDTVDSDEDGTPDDCETCPGDANGDGQVNGADLAFVLGWWGTDEASADFNQDGMVDGADLSYVLGYWGSCSTP